MRGITFNGKHSYWDWRLMLAKPPKVSSPEPKTHYVDIPGAHGAMDLTEALTGKVQFHNRKIELEFITVADREDWSAIYSDILSSLHGQVAEISMDDDPQHYYKGRVTVGDPERDKRHVIVKMTAEVEPFKRTYEGTEML
jgi:phage-related protein